MRTNGLRRSRYIGAAKTHLQQAITAAAINLGRIADWIANHNPRTDSELRLRPPHGRASLSECIRQQYRFSHNTSGFANYGLRTSSAISF